MPIHVKTDNSELQCLNKLASTSSAVSGPGFVEHKNCIVNIDVKLKSTYLNISAKAETREWLKKKT